MEIAAKPLKKPIKKLEYDSTVHEFIAQNKIRSHTTLHIPVAVIYLRYHKWCKINNVKPKSIVIFSQQFATKFEKKIGKRHASYFVSPEGFDISDSNLQEATKFMQDVKNGKKKKEKKPTKGDGKS